MLLVMKLGFSWRLLLCILAGFTIVGCSAQTGNVTLTVTEATAPATPTFTLQPSATATATATPLPPTPTATHTPTLTPTIYPLPSFETDGLKPDVIPHAYLADSCEYLANRWDPDKSAPGTVVLPIMYHSIVPDGQPLTDYSAVSEEYFHTTMQTAEILGFEAISTRQLVDFLYENAYIPPRSMVLIVDDRKRGAYYDIFTPYLQEHNWVVVNAWISHPDTPAFMYNENRPFADAGLVDFQAHGVIHNITMSEDALPEYVQQEIYGPLTVIPERFGVPTPLAFIWPGGRFSAYAVQVADEAGYKIGFTVFARGPVMYNWVPQGAEERAVDNALLVLPRAWSTAAANNLYQAAEIGDRAREYAEQNRESEIDWYNHYCSGYPPIQNDKVQP